MPRISGRSGNVLVLPILPRPRARSVPRCFGLVPIDDLIWVTKMVASAMRCSRCGGGLLALVVRVEQTLRHELGRVEAAALGDVVGTLQRLEAGDGGAGDVDVVGRAERLAEHVVHAGLFEDDSGCAAGDDAGTGSSRLHHDL